MVLELKDDSFAKEVLEKSTEKPVLVDFWAPWCTPCLMSAPVYESVSAQYTDSVVFAKANVDVCTQTAQEQFIMGIPALKLYYKGEVIAELSGAFTESRLTQWLNVELGKLR